MWPRRGIPNLAPDGSPGWSIGKIYEPRRGETNYDTKMKRSLLLILISVLALASTLAAQQNVTVTVDQNAPGIAIPNDYMGLSFESAAILPDANGHYQYFRPDNRPLIELFKTLGIRNLRIGGNTSDRPTVKVPSQPDIDAVYGFARAAGANVIYTVRLRDSKPEDVISTAKYVVDHYNRETLCLTIGNEPNVYEKEYPKYRDDLKRFIAAITAVAPGAKFCGPATTPGTGGWAANFAADFGPSGNVVEVTQHSYPGGNSRKVTDPAAGREKMLSPEFAQQYQKLYDAFVPAVLKNGLTYRVEETNSFFNGGAEDVSNTFASALWGLDYLYWWAAHNARGINFHTGDNVAAGEKQTPCWYATFWSEPGGGYVSHPIAYAIKAFDLGSHGKLMPVHVSTGAANLSAYAVLGTDRTLYVTLINKDKAPSNVSIAAQGLRGKPTAMFLTAPKSDMAATGGVTLGTSSISTDGSWSGTWEVLKSDSKQVTITLPPASAAVVKITLK